MEETVKVIFQKASALGVCSRFKGSETLGELVELFFSPQGVEFCSTGF